MSPKRFTKANIALAVICVCSLCACDFQWVTVAFTKHFVNIYIATAGTGYSAVLSLHSWSHSGDLPAVPGANANSSKHCRTFQNSCVCDCTKRTWSDWRGSGGLLQGLGLVSWITHVWAFGQWGCGGGSGRRWGGGVEGGVWGLIMGHHLFVVDGTEAGGKTGGCEGVVREFRTDWLTDWLINWLIDSS